MRMPLRLVLLALTPALSSQTRLAFLEGPSATDLRLQVIDEADPTATPLTAMSGLEIIDSEITNRTAQQALRADRPRRVVHLGLTRIELPGNGRLLRYRRAQGTRFGVLWIDARGGPIVLIELPGTGASQTGDPFADRFGVANDGLHAAFVTATGALYLVRIDGQSYASTGMPGRPLAVADVDPLSVCVGSTHVFFQTEDGRVWRCAVADGGVPEDVTPPTNAGERLEGSMAPSGDGSAVVFLLGPVDSYTLWLLGTTGPAVALPPAPSKYEEPGYLPETANGPRLLLNEDATRLMYVDATRREEVYLLDTTGATPTTHITSDPNFEPYIGISILPAFVANVLTVALGDPGQFDWFQATTATSAVTPVTLTGANATAPFAPGQLLPVNGAVLSSGVALAEEATASGTALRQIDLRTGATSVLTAALRASPVLGRADGGTANVLVPALSGDSLLTPALNAVLSGPPGLWLSPDAQAPSGLFSVFSASLPSGPGAAILRLPGGALYALRPDPLLREATATPGGGLVVSGTHFLYARVGQPLAFPSTQPVRFVLS